MTIARRLFAFAFALVFAQSLFAQIDTPQGTIPSSPIIKGSRTQEAGALERIFGKSTNSTPKSALEPLPVELAFKVTAVRKPTGVSIRLEAAPGYYLYREKIKILATDTVTDLTPALPKGVIKFDETFGKNLATYYGTVDIPEIKHGSRSKGADMALSLDLYTQGCADIGVCYPPQYHRLNFLPNQATPQISTFEPATLPATVSTATIAAAARRPATLPATASSPATAITPKNDVVVIPTQTVFPPQLQPAASTSSVSHLFKNTHPLWMMLAFFGFGILLALTPCVLPMIPIVSAIVLGTSNHSRNPNHFNNTHSDAATPISTKQALQRSVSYVLGMSLMYTAAGVLAGLAGQGLAGFLQQAWVLYSFAGLMVVLAGAQFGWYHLALPSALTDRIASKQSRLQNGQGQSSGFMRYVGITCIGALSALMVGPCLTAPLAGTLSYIAQTGDAWLGGLALFGLSLGMGAPLLAISVGGAHWLPKAGAWMSQVNYGFGLMLLSVALWMVQSLLPDYLFTLLCMCLLLLMAQAFGVFQVFSSVQQNRIVSLCRGLGLICLVWVLAIVWGMAAGRFDPLTPLKGVEASNARFVNGALNSVNNVTQFETVAAAEIAQRLKQQGSKPILLDLYADWCVSCIEFERYTFTDPQVSKQLTAFTLLRVDVTDNTVHDRALLKQLGLFGPPAILFFNQQRGQPYIESPQARVIGFQAAAVFSQHLRTVLSQSD